MTLVAGFQKLLSADVHGHYGRSNGYGRIRHGNAAYGLLDVMCGIYIKHRTAKGWGTSLAKFYRPTNPQTIPQQNWRGVFSDAVAQWHLLTPTQKGVYTREGRGAGLNGFQRFTSLYLRSHLL